MRSQGEDNYHRVAGAALAWVVHHRTQFSLANGDAAVLVKPLGELAIASDLLVSRFPPASQLHVRGTELLSFCWAELDEGNLLDQLVSARPDLIVAATLYTTFHRHGMRNQKLEQSLVRIVRIRGIAGLELPAWRELELAIAFRTLEIDAPWVVDASFRRTWLYKRPEPWSICNTSAYSLTHTVFYQTNFGATPLELPARHRRYLARWLPVWMEHYTDLQNYDLLAEMVLAARCIGEPDSRDWGSVLLAAQQSNGMIPNASSAGTSIDPTASDPTRRSFLKNYHSTLVSLLACAMSMARSDMTSSQLP